MVSRKVYNPHLERSVLFVDTYEHAIIIQVVAESIFSFQGHPYLEDGSGLELADPGMPDFVGSIIRIKTSNLD